MNKWLMDKLCFCGATGFGLGFLPFAPGSFGSLLGIPIFLLTNSWSPWLQGILFATFCLVSIGLSEKIERESRVQDPSFVVIDEVVGMWITLFFLWRTDWIVIGLGFLLFRSFDVLKFFPLNIFESFRGGVGIVADDLAAGMLANICLRIILLSGILG